MSVLADDVAAHDWSLAGAGICREAGRSMATLTSQRQICTSVAVADRGPARKIGIFNLRGGEREHDVWILIAVCGGGLNCGVEPRLRGTMIFVPPPQPGHGRVTCAVAATLSERC